MLEITKFEDLFLLEESYVNVDAWVCFQRVTYWSIEVNILIFLVWTTRFIIDLDLILHHNLKYPIIYWISESLGKWKQSNYFAFSWCYRLILKFHMWCMLESGRPPTVAGWTLALEKMVHNPPKNSKHNPA